MRHGERVHHIHASGDPPADRHFADAEKFGAFAEVNGVFEVHTKPIVSTGGLGIGGIVGNSARRNSGLTSYDLGGCWMSATLADILF